MNIVLFYHSLISDWNHGNAHFLRGIVTDLRERRHQVTVYEPKDGWSLKSLIAEHGEQPLTEFQSVYPGLESVRYDQNTLDLDAALKEADVVIVHEWNDSELINRIGEHRSKNSHYLLFFHDTHHRLVTSPSEMSRFKLDQYDGVLAYGKVLRDLYVKEQRARNVWVWHEAADTRIFRPCSTSQYEGDLVWIGNWGDEERTEELKEFLIEPVKSLGLKARIYGVRYPDHAKQALADAGIEYGGWLPNYKAPKVLARYKLTVHVPRRPYVQALPGIPTIRVFEALACGIPLICSPWRDAENLFTPGKDFLTASSGKEMRRQLALLLENEPVRKSLSDHGLQTIRTRHTCAHRADELLNIVNTISKGTLS